MPCSGTCRETALAASARSRSTSARSKSRFSRSRRASPSSRPPRLRRPAYSSGKQYDLIVDTKTNRSPFAYARALKPTGTYATVGGENARVFQLFLGGWCLSRMMGKNLRMLALKQNSHLAYLAERCEAGQLVP